MKRNHYRNIRRRSSLRTEEKLGIALALVFVCVVVGGGVSLLSYRTRCSALGNEIRKLEANRDALNKELIREEAKWADFRRPDQIQDALTRHGLDMSIPRGEQIVELRGSQPYSPQRGGASSVAANPRR